MKSHSRAWLPAALLTIGLCLTLALAQKRPNVSGTWKMNPAKSKFSTPGGPEEMVIEFEQQGDSLYETFTVSEEHHEHSFELEYTLDGEKQTQEVDGLEGEVSAKWEGETLLLLFFQAEDGIRDPLVTGVQTCALPILYGVTMRLMSVDKDRIETLGVPYTALKALFYLKSWDTRPPEFDGEEDLHLNKRLSSPLVDLISDMGQLDKLRKRGAITESEFQRKRRKILDNI